MKIRMLGPFAAEIEGQPLKLAGPKQRAVLSLLALRANHTVLVDEIVEGLWGEEPPGSATKMVQQYVSQLRRLLGDDEAEIVTHGQGYELRLDPEAVDALRFERLVHHAHRYANGGCGELAREALELWEGSPLADLREEPFAAPEVRRLEELRLGAAEIAIESELAAGHGAEVVAQLQALVEENPLRERLRGLLMLALYRGGRQAEALAVFQDARYTLVEELGLEPGPELRRLQEAILRQDPELEKVVPDREWASRETAEQLDAGADDLTRRRDEMRASGRRLIEHVLDLQHLQQAVGPASPSPCPFKGLEPFDQSDADVFFGREELVAGIVARLPGTSLLGVVGPSGSGKSSAVKAGLLPALGSGVLPGSARWRTAVMRPGERPLAALRAAASGVGTAARLVLVVDQFEEAFTACRAPGERWAFFDALVEHAEDPRTLVVLTIRADFYGACAAHPPLAALLADNHVLVGPMRADEVRRAIERPAQRAGLIVEPELVDRLVEAAAGRAGALPLLQVTLLELWQRRAGNHMTLRAYEQTAGLDGAVARLAEAAYATLTAEQAAAARRILLRLAGDPDGQALVRRSTPLAELELDRQPVARRVVDVLTDHRLLTLGSDSVEIAHEALLREWPRLRTWLDEDAELRRVHRHLTHAASEWDAGGRDAGELYRGARLASAADLATEHPDVLNALERAFVEESRLASDRETLRARRANRRLRALLAGALAMLVVAATAGLAALDQRSDARGAARAADAQRLAAQALTVDRLDRALLLARAAVALDDSVETRGGLLSVLLRTPPALMGVLDPGSAVQDIVVSPRGDLVAVADATGVVRMHRLPDRRPAGTYRLGRVHRLRFARDGSMLLVSGHDPATRPQYPVVDLVDIGTLRRRRGLALPTLSEPVERVEADAAFSGDADEVIVVQTAPGTSVPGVRRRFEAGTGRERGTAMPVEAGVAPELALVGRTGHASAAAVAASGAVALGEADGRLRVTGDRGTRELRTSHEGPVTRVAFTADERTLVSAGTDGAVLVHDVQTGTLRERLDGHTRRVGALAITPGDDALFTGGDDGRALMFDLSVRRRFIRPIPLGAPYRDTYATARPAAVSRTGATLAVAQRDGTVTLLDTARLRPRDRLRVGSGPVLGLAFSPDGRRLATSGDAGEVALWDLRSLTRTATLEGLVAWAEPLAFSRDGRLLASATLHTDPGRTALWDARRLVRTGFESTSAATSLAFSPDGRRLASATGRTAEIRDVATGRVLHRIDTPTPRVVTFSPDGSSLFVGTADGSGWLVSTTDWKRVGGAVRFHARRITSAVFTPDGRTLVTASADGAVLLSDVRTRKPIGPPLVVRRDAPVTAALSPDAATLYAVSTGTSGLRIPVGVSAWKRHACRVAGRPLSKEEWREVLPRHAFRRVC
jgi:DNA-binding SARP family transcriptional activator/WD40 repeat protein